MSMNSNVNSDRFSSMRKVSNKMPLMTYTFLEFKMFTTFDYCKIDREKRNVNDGTKETGKFMLMFRSARMTPLYLLCYRIG